MNHFRLSIVTILLFATAGLSACLTGGGSTGAPPSGPGGALPTGIIRGAPSGGLIPGAAEATSPGGTSPGAPPPGSAAAAGGGSDTAMPPRADLGDCMTLELDPVTGTWYCGDPMQYACRIWYVPAPSIKVMSGTGEPLPPILIEGAKTFSGRFYAETGRAPLECLSPSCWTWEAANGGEYLLLRLSRRRPDAPMDQFYRNLLIDLFPAGGANVSLADLPIQDEDAIEFYATYSELKPIGYSESLVPLTDEVWTNSGIKCEMGGFRIDTGTAYEIKRDGLTLPRFDELGIDRILIKK